MKIRKSLKYINIMLLLLFSGLLLFANFGISEHDEFINSTFFERRKHISTDGPYIIYDEKEGNRVIEIDSKFSIKEYDLLNKKQFDVRSKYKKLAKKLGVGYSTYLLGKKSEMGRWLRSKNTIEKIGEYLFVHGGIGAEMDMKKMDMDTINSQVRQYIQNPVLEQKDEFLFGKAGPLWYRGYIRNQGDSISNHIENVLNFYNVNKIIVGHSTVSRIKSYCNDKVIDVDVHFPSDSKDKTTIGQCLLIKKSGEYYRVLSNGEKELLFEDKF